MFEWISNNSDTINAVTSVAMLFVWIGYLQIFLYSYRRQVRPKLVINRAAGSALDASCFVSNMSSESIYLESVIVNLSWNDHNISHGVTDLDAFNEDNRPSDPRQRTLQGPLRPGDYTSIGTFGELIDKVVQGSGREVGEVRNEAEKITVEVLVIADYLSDSLLVAAKRTFKAVFTDGNWKTEVDSVETQQIRSRSERRKVRDLLANEQRPLPGHLRRFSP